MRGERPAHAGENARAPVARTYTRRGERSGAIYVDEAPIPPDALAPRLEQIAVSSTEEGGPRIFLRADRGLDYGRVIQLMGELNAAGLRRIALVSTQEGEGG